MYIGQESSHIAPPKSDRHRQEQSERQTDTPTQRNTIGAVPSYEGHKWADAPARFQAAENERNEDAESPEVNIDDIKIETLLLISNHNDESRNLVSILSMSNPNIWRPMEVLLQFLDFLPRADMQQLETNVKCIMATLYNDFGDGCTYRLAPEFEQVLRETHRSRMCPALALLPAQIVERPLFVYVCTTDSVG